MSEYTVITANERAGFLALADKLVLSCWPEFMLHDPLANEHWRELYEKFPAYQFGLTEDGGDDLIAVGNSIPLAWEGNPAELPDEGWDWAVKRGFADFAAGRTPTVLCALAIMVAPPSRGQGISTRMVQTMKSIGKAHGLSSLIAPVRPSSKHRYPLIPMERYIRWRNENGLPFDPWMRVHAKLGAEIIKPCPQSMRITGSISDWEEWTKMRFPESGEYIIPEALVPVEFDRENNQGTYIEPNVWMWHSIR